MAAASPSGTSTHHPELAPSTQVAPSRSDPPWTDSSTRPVWAATLCLLLCRIQRSLRRRSLGTGTARRLPSQQPRSRPAQLGRCHAIVGATILLTCETSEPRRSILCALRSDIDETGLRSESLAAVDVRTVQAQRATT